MEDVRIVEIVSELSWTLKIGTTDYRVKSSEVDSVHLLYIHGACVLIGSDLFPRAVLPGRIRKVEWLM